MKFSLRPEGNLTEAGSQSHESDGTAEAWLRIIAARHPRELNRNATDGSIEQIATGVGVWGFCDRLQLCFPPQ